MENSITRIAPVEVTFLDGKGNRHTELREVKFIMSCLVNDEMRYEINCFDNKTSITLNKNRILSTGIEMFVQITAMYVINGIITNAILK